MQMLLAYLDLRRAQPKAALDRIRRAVDADPNNIEGLFTRAEIATLSGAADAPALVRSLLAGNANGLEWRRTQSRLHTPIISTPAGRRRKPRS
ncbi:MAG TPA: hypothetical protein VES67_13965 [Vicinamibacterales bacterium]|nr:hypothetical protein [Vicinamibacterales bacterium]